MHHMLKEIYSFSSQQYQNLLLFLLYLLICSEHYELCHSKFGCDKRLILLQVT